MAAPVPALGPPPEVLGPFPAVVKRLVGKLLEDPEAFLSLTTCRFTAAAW